MQKTLIIAAILGLFYINDASAQDKPKDRNHARTGMQRDSTRGPGGRFRDMETASVNDLPASVAPFVKQTYPNAEMKRIAKDKEGKFFMVLTETDKPRRLLVVDSKGTVLTNKEMPARKGGHGKGGHGNRPSSSR